MLRPRRRGSLRPFSPPQKSKPRTSQNPLSKNPLSATHEKNNSRNDLRSVDMMSVLSRFHILQSPSRPRLPNIIRGGSMSVINYLINCHNNRSPVRNFGDSVCTEHACKKTRPLKRVQPPDRFDWSGRFPCFASVSAVFGSSSPISPSVPSDTQNGPLYTPRTLRFKGLRSKFDTETPVNWGQKPKLGGRFGPGKKIFSPPPPSSPIRHRHPPGPSAPPGTPLPWDFQ